MPAMLPGAAVALGGAGATVAMAIMPAAANAAGAAPRGRYRTRSR